MRAALAVLLLLAATPARADTWQAVYNAYVAGMDAVRLQVTLDLDGAGYRVDVQSRTVGLVDFFIGSRQSTRVDGVWGAGQPRPRQYHAEGVMRGERRLTVIDYHDGQPSVLGLLPPDPSREPVPDALRGNTLDRISPLAYLVWHAARTGDCASSATIFDGRRLEESTARTGGWDDLPRGNVSVFAGRALRCEIALRQTAGFAPEEDRAQAGRVRQVQVWLASPAAGAPMLPVRISIDVGWLGHAIVHLSELHRAAP